MGLNSYKKKRVKRCKGKEEVLALIRVSSQRIDRSAGIAFLAFNFSCTKRLEIEKQLLIFPISCHDKSCSDIQQAETKGLVSLKRFSRVGEL